MIDSTYSELRVIIFLLVYIFSHFLFLTYQPAISAKKFSNWLTNFFATGVKLNSGPSQLAQSFNINSYAILCNIVIMNILKIHFVQYCYYEYAS